MKIACTHLGGGGRGSGRTAPKATGGAPPPEPSPPLLATNSRRSRQSREGRCERVAEEEDKKWDTWSEGIGWPGLNPSPSHRAHTWRGRRRRPRHRRLSCAGKRPRQSRRRKRSSSAAVGGEKAVPAPFFAAGVSSVRASCPRCIGIHDMSKVFIFQQILVSPIICAYIHRPI